MEPFATVEDLEARWRPLSTQEKERAAVLLEDGSLYIIVCVGKLPDNVPLAKTVLCTMVKRAMLADVNQAPLKSFQQGAGPYQETQTFANPTGDLYLTSSEKSLLGVRKSHVGFSMQEEVQDDSG